MFFKVLACIFFIFIGSAEGLADSCDTKRDNLSRFFANADEFIPSPGPVPYCQVITGGKVVGALVSTWDTVRTAGYSGKPVDIRLAISPDGIVLGALLSSHSEPILIIGIKDSDLIQFVNSFVGRNMVTGGFVGDGQKKKGVDAIAGATVSSAVIRSGVMRAVQAVVADIVWQAGDKSQRGPRLKTEYFIKKDWVGLIADRSITSRIWFEEDINGLWGRAGSSGKQVLKLYTGLASQATIGENLFGKELYDDVRASHPDAHFIFVAGQGLYSFKGREWRRTGSFDQLQLVQDEQVFGFTADNHRRIDRIKAGAAPDMREMGIFIINKDSDFDPVKSWRLDVLLKRDMGDGTLHEGTISLPYTLPSQYIASPPVLDMDGARVEMLDKLWRDIWQERALSITFVVALLLLLTIFLFYQDSFETDSGLYMQLRTIFLLVTCVVVGFVIGGQLSVVNIFTYIQALLNGFRWEFFMIDPITFILWSFVAVSLLFWGRGIYCGWLCPFGALQELINRLSQRLGIKQIQIPFRLHERLWALKHIIFLVLMAVSLSSIDEAFRLAEIEPFKTVFVMQFQRSWPFLLFVGVLLVAGLFINRFYCRYLCPLGAALAIPARLTMFRWLKRRHQCGAQCSICTQDCPIQAIHPEGNINPNECIYCLSCQVNYYDDTLCPPLVKKRRRREQRLAQTSKPQKRAATEGDAE